MIATPRLRKYDMPDVASMFAVAHLKGMTKAQMIDRIYWLEERPYFPNARRDADFLRRELTLGSQS